MKAGEYRAEKMAKLSVVIIIYKVEKYLRSCIESVMNQKYTDLEIILVDDGSPDGCPKLCDEYAEKDSRIRVIHQQNQGSVTARWNGLLAAEGEYVSFVDGDDWLEEDMYARMMRAADEQKADMVISGYKEEYSDHCVNRGNPVPSGIYRGSDLETIQKKALYTGKFYEAGIIPALWNKVIRRELFQKDFQPIEKMIRMGDDAGLSYPMIARAESIVIENALCAYHYRKLQGSLSTGFDEKYFERGRLLISGLQKNLACNRLVADSLPYYSLFLFKTGIYSVLAQKFEIREKIRRLEEALAQFAGLIPSGGIDWSGFSDREKKEFHLLLKGNVKGYVLLVYFNKIKARLLKKQ